MLTSGECPEMNFGTGRFSDDVEMTVVQSSCTDDVFRDIVPDAGSGSWKKNSAADSGEFD